MNNPELIPINIPEIPKGKLDADLEKYNKAIKESSDEYRRMIDAVNRYLKGKVTDELSYEDILEYYYNKYSNIYQEMLESAAPINLSTAQRMNMLKRIIYNLEVKKLEENDPDKLKNTA